MTKEVRGRGAGGGLGVCMCVAWEKRVPGMAGRDTRVCRVVESG